MLPPCPAQGPLLSAAHHPPGQAWAEAAGWDRPGSGDRPPPPLCRPCGATTPNPLWARLTGRIPSRTAVRTARPETERAARSAWLATPGPGLAPGQWGPFCPLGTRAPERGWPEGVREGPGSQLGVRKSGPSSCAGCAALEVSQELGSFLGLLTPPLAPGLKSCPPAELHLPNFPFLPLKGGPSPASLRRRQGREGAGQQPGGGEVTSYPHARGMAPELAVATEDGRLGRLTPAPARTLEPSAHFRAPTVTVSTVTQTEGPGSWHWAGREVLLTAPPKPSREGFLWSCDPNRLTRSCRAK